jgi:hypothetical protein
MTRWQFSLRSLLILMTVVSVAVFFVAKYPTIALLSGCAIAWALFESGMIVQIVNALSKPTMYERHPILATSTWLFTGTFSIAASGLFLWSVFDSRREAPFWLPLIPAIALAGFGMCCFCLIWDSFKQPMSAKGSAHGGAADGTPPVDKEITMES